MPPGRLARRRARVRWIQLYDQRNLVVWLGSVHLFLLFKGVIKIARTVENCILKKNYQKLNVREPQIVNGKCEGYGFLNPNGKYTTCEKCRLYMNKGE